MAPMSPWEAVAGKKCLCGNPATHYYVGQPVCCQCHGGNIFSPEDAQREHEEILKRDK